MHCGWIVFWPTAPFISLASCCCKPRNEVSCPWRKCGRAFWRCKIHRGWSYSPSIYIWLPHWGCSGPLCPGLYPQLQLLFTGISLQIPPNRLLLLLTTFQERLSMRWRKTQRSWGGYVAILLGTAIFVMSWLAKLLKVLTNHRNPTLGWVRGES